MRIPRTLVLALIVWFLPQLLLANGAFGGSGGKDLQYFEVSSTAYRAIQIKLLQQGRCVFNIQGEEYSFTRDEDGTIYTEEQPPRIVTPIENN